MSKWLSKFWRDPVWSAVLAAVIAAGILEAVKRLSSGHSDGWPDFFRAYQIPFWLLISLIFLTFLGFALFWWRKDQLLQPKIALTDVTTRPPATEKGITYPLKCRVQFRNDSTLCADVSISGYKPDTVTIKKFLADVLQIKLREWEPSDHGVDRLAVLPGQFFQAWIGVDESKFNAEQVSKLRGRIGTLILMVNGKRLNIDL